MAQVSEVQFVSISQAAAAATIVAAAGAGIKIRVVSLFLVSTAAQSFNFKSAAGGTALNGSMALAANGIFVLPFCPTGWFETLANQLLELATGGTQISGTLGYVLVQ